MIGHQPGRALTPALSQRERGNRALSWREMGNRALSLWERVG
jgi:hypothetical protein